MENSRTCENSNVNVHRAPYAKHLRSKKHLENTKQDEIFITEWLFEEKQAPNKINLEKMYKPKPLKQIARQIFNLNDKELDKESAKKP